MFSCSTVVDTNSGYYSCSMLVDTNSGYLWNSIISVFQTRRYEQGYIWDSNIFSCSTLVDTNSEYVWDSIIFMCRRMIVIVILPRGGPDKEHVGVPYYVHGIDVRYGCCHQLSSDMPGS